MEISMHITESCNLNCKSCMHMTPLADNYYYYIEGNIRSQLEYLAKHINIIHRFNIMGGEPTMHPNVISVLYVAREYLPNIEIALVTNGVNSKIFEDEIFIKALKRNNIIVCLTAYPYSDTAEEKYTNIINILQKENIKFYYNKISKFLTQPFDRNLQNDITQKKWCKTFQYCTMLKDYKLYVCHLAAYSYLLKEKFDDTDWIETDDNMFVDLRDHNLTDNMIIEKMSSLSKICTHCVELNRGWKSDNEGEMIDWNHSKCEKSEWIKE